MCGSNKNIVQATFDKNYVLFGNREALDSDDTVPKSIGAEKHQEWIDERLTWDPLEYNNLSRIRIPCQKLWLPDIVLYNSADDYKTDYMQSKAMVQSNGNVFWPPPAKLRSTCKIDITYFPFDDQSCMMKFGSWTYDGWQVNVIKRHDEVDTSNYVENGEWDLLKVVVERNEIFYPCCQEPYPDLRFTIYMRRRTLYYLFNIIFPCLWLTVLSLISFWLPPDSGEKITLGITVLLAFSVFMLLIAENMPATSEFVPLIGVYLTVTMTMTSLSIILTVLVLHLHHTGSNRQAVPKFIRILFFNYIARILCSDVVRRYQARREKCVIKRTNLLRQMSLNKKRHTNSISNDDKASMNYHEKLINTKPTICNSSNLNKPLQYNYLPSDVISSTIVLNEKKQMSACKYATNSSNTTAATTTEQQVDKRYKTIEPLNTLSSPNLNTVNTISREEIIIKRPKLINTFRIINDLNKDNNLDKESQSHKTQTSFKQNKISSDHRTIYAKSSNDLNNNDNNNDDDDNGDNDGDYVTTLNPLNRRTTYSPRQINENKEQIKVLKKLTEILQRAEKQQEIIQIYLHNLYEKQSEEEYISDIINEWRILALIVDRMLFWLFLTVASIATIVILLIMPLFKPNFA
ncbi:unnamed protein product [Trichobilharzia szidati]|nr:unnamed protein product [Trichobilharzia szidati]